MKTKKSLLNISKKTFIQVCILLASLMIFSIILTYVIKKGEFGLNSDGSINYQDYHELTNIKGINIFKGLFSFILVFTSNDGLNLIMLSLFLIIISSSFQVMNDVGGIKSLIKKIANKFKDNRHLLVIIISFVFMCFGSFLGLFEEMLTLLPIITILMIAVGYDSFTGFLVCIISCGFGFASAITNPFTVLLASEYIGINPLNHIYYLLIIFVIMFLFLLSYIFSYIRKIEKDKLKSYTYQHDLDLNIELTDTDKKEDDNEKKVRIVYLIFLSLALLLIILVSLIKVIRGYSVPILIIYFLFGGLLCGYLVKKDFKFVLKSFLKGLLGALPTIAFIALAASIKYIFDEGKIMPTIINQINIYASDKNPIFLALIIYLIVLVLEFFISSSTAKAILVMGILSGLTLGLSKEMLVLLYTFGDGYTNVIFPTSPVLLISLSMIGLDYFKWIKKSWWFFIINFIIVIGLILLGIVIKY